MTSYRCIPAVGSRNEQNLNSSSLLQDLPQSLPKSVGKSSRQAEVAAAERQIAAAELPEHCGVLPFS
jgi:hypothetical protein